MEMVLARYPDCRCVIMKLYKTNAEFRDLCSDYGELVLWFATERHSKNATAVQIHEYRIVLHELETEILRYLNRVSECFESSD